MVNIITSKGKFNISESLFDAIKNNNPELLTEARKHSRTYNHLEGLIDNDKSKLALFINELNTIVNSVNNTNGQIDDDIKLAMNDIWNDYENGKYDSVIDDIENKNLKTNLIDGLHNMRHAYLKKKDKNSFQTLMDKEKDINQNNQNNQNNENNKNNGVELMKQCLSSTDLIKQIAYTENLAGLLVEKCKKLIQRELGIWGDATISNKSQKSTAKYDEDTGEQIDIDVNPYYNNTNNSNNTTDTEIAKIKKNIGNKTPLKRKLKSELQLATGGFKFYPAFNNMADRDLSGKALKYYKSILQPTNNSLIDNMIDIEIALKDRAYDKDIEDAVDGISIRKKFENMVFNYLHNVVYNLDINNPEKYNSIVRILSWDDKLKRDFNINNTANVQQFDVREQMIYFIKKTDGIPTLLIIAKPLFAKGSALAKTAFDTFSRYRLNRN